MHMPTHFSLGALTALTAVASSLAASACSSDSKETGASSGGAVASGGASSSGGASGGAPASGGATSSGGAAQGGTSSGGSAAALYGTFVVSLNAATETVPAYTGIQGRLFDGPSPPAFPMKVSREEGSCRLLVPFVPFCDPACGSGSVCTADNVCTPNPKPRDIGTASVRGIGDAPVIMKPGASAVYQPSEVLPNPPCAEGADVSLDSDTVKAHVKCIAPLKVTTTEPVPVQSGAAVPLAWTPAGAASDSKIRIRLDLAYHGGRKGEINCEVPDTGSFQVPEGLVTELVRLGLAGFPVLGMDRVAIGSSTEMPNVSLLMSSFVELALDTGVKSCDSDEDCAGKTCALDKTCK